VKRIRSEIGSKIKLMIDANHAYNALSAIKLAKGVEEYDITWFEEPVPPEDYAGYCEVKREVSIPIAGGEAEF
ncbi:mandelate racemase/muconate lactonizing enzyme family protein, partial [[Clostridium] symbiosum]|uniref:enolase C-terminal domain-like protein n=2 Tax=Bacillota TaxID=1239 RepID=UPI002442EA18